MSMRNWTKEQIFNDGDSYFACMLADIAKARESIKFETYIFRQDVLGERVILALSEAAKRGTNVELLLDGVGSRLLPPEFLNHIRALGIHLAIYHPMPSFFKLHKLWRSLGEVNQRNHRKVCIIDSRIAYVGGMNISSQHLAEVQSVEAWRDTGVCVEGDAVADLCLAFDKSYSAALRQKVPVARERISDLVKLNDSRSKRQKYRAELLSRIRAAKNFVWITCPYFLPPPNFINALCQAAKARVDVCLLLPFKRDHFFMRWVNSFYYTHLLKNGVRVYEYMASPLHAKTQLIDDWATIGSSNKNYRSFFNDLEVDIVLTQRESKENLKEQFLNDLKLSQQIHFIEWKKRSGWHRLAELFLFLFRKWL